MDVTNLRFLFYGYSAAWIIVIAFILILVRRENRINRELRRLRALIDHRNSVEQREKAL